ncbi:basic proline-rich protein-like [Microtus oregoni]|uniref:basic proline-rich protein-like n=1 Tax=Microtus oregoni TaxID=111838 RepID=UPI001BB12412|nr:basic proline-rich protein-like [Microtus oregoni]
MVTGAAAAGADAAHLLPRRPPPEGRAPQPTCKRRVGPGPGGGSSVARSGGGTRLRCGSGADAVHRGARARLTPPRSLPQPRRARPRTARARTEDGARPGRAGLGSGASPPGAAPSDRLPPPPPRGHRAPAQREGRARPGFCPPGLGSLLRNAQAGPLTLRPPLRPLLGLRLALLCETHKPGSRGAGGGGRRHPRVIGRSNREPSARPRVQPSNRAEEELPPKTAKIGHRDTHRARPAYFPKSVPPDRLSVRDP